MKSGIVIKSASGYFGSLTFLLNSPRLRLSELLFFKNEQSSYQTHVCGRAESQNTSEMLVNFQPLWGFWHSCHSDSATVFPSPRNLTLLLPWCSCIRSEPSRSRISPRGSLLPLGCSNAEDAATGANCKQADDQMSVNQQGHLFIPDWSSAQVHMDVYRLKYIRHSFIEQFSLCKWAEVS